KIRQYLNKKDFVEADTTSLEKFIFEQCCRLEQTSILLSLVEQYLREQNILQPATRTLHRLIGEQRRLARQHIYEQITSSLSGEIKQKIDGLLEVEENSFSLLQQLKQPPKSPSPNAMKELTQKLAIIFATGILDVDLSWLNNNYQRTLTNYVKECSAYRLRELTPSHCNAAITCFLWQTYRDTIDQIVDMYDKLITKVYNWASEDLNEELKQKRRLIKQALEMFTTVGEVVLDENVSDNCVRETLFKQVNREELEAQISQWKEWTKTKSSNLFLAVIERFNYLRQFSPTFLKHLELSSPQKKSTSLLDATEILKELNSSGKRKLPDCAPLDFVPKKLIPFVENKGEINKHAWECALLTKIRDEVKSSNLSVTHSKRFGNFDDFFIDRDKWLKIRESFFSESGLPQDSEDVPSYLKKRLNEAYDNFLFSLPNNTYAKINAEGWQLETDPVEKLQPQEEEKLDELRSWLKKRMRSIKLPELLIEVDNELNFTHYFMTPAQKVGRNPSDICAIIATIMAHGCNIGPHTMSQLTQATTYEEIKQITDWQLIEENQRGALAIIVNAIAALDTSQRWGQGKTSASDGQRFAFHRRVLQQTYSPTFSDFALEFYSFVADNYAPYYSMPIECSDRDAPFVLDGLLYNESDLQLEEHYTDTHGYTEINFAAFAMLGKRFCPRIRQLHRQRIYRIDEAKDYGPLGALVNRRDRTIKEDFIVSQWDRMGQFYATLKTGHTTASVALKRLNSMSKKNQFYLANREFGRVFKTEFILQYMSIPPLRRKVKRGLLKNDQIHALAREVAYGKQGQITQRDFSEIMKSCSCLTLILACIIYWQAREIETCISECHPEEEDIDISLLQHISPVEWENVVLYGEYVIDPKLIR
ncbi:MAG: Tn3 family transposase, partial [Planctomycetota bacterium]